MSWLQISVTTREDLAPRLSDLLSELGALSVTMQDACGQEIYEPPPGETRIWKSTRLTGLFEAGTCGESVHSSLQGALDASEWSTLLDWQEQALEDQAWERAWLEHFRPMQFGRNLWIVPTGYEPPAPEAVNLHLDPGLAFGTGTHATTALCLEWLDSNPVDQQTVIDFGCGSGILGIAAAMLGATRVIAIDIDPQALMATRSNAEINGVSARIDCFLPADAAPIVADSIIANILATPLIDLAEKISSQLRKGGNLVLSGILPDQAEAVMHAYQPWIRFSPKVEKDGWMRLQGTRHN